MQMIHMNGPRKNPDDFFLNSRYSYDFTMLRRMLSDFESYTIFPIHCVSRKTKATSFT